MFKSTDPYFEIMQQEPLWRELELRIQDRFKETGKLFMTNLEHNHLVYRLFETTMPKDVGSKWMFGLTTRSRIDKVLIDLKIEWER